MTTTRRVLVTAPYFVPVVPRFRERFAANGLVPVVLRVEERAQEAELLSALAGIDAAICGDDQFTERVLLQAPQLRVICKWGTGIDSIDLAACEKRGIVIRNTPNAFSVPVAESVLAYALAFARQSPWMDAAMKSGEWRKLPGVTLSESTLGIIGVGNVGSCVARRFAAFDGRLLGCDIRPIDPAILRATGLSQVDLDTILAESDYISVNCDLNPTSHHLVNRSTLAKMKSDAVVINTSRGPVIDEPALVEALSNGAIRGAALDVFEEEPLPASSPLREMENVLLAPHNSNSSPTYWERVHEHTFSCLVEELDRLE